MRPLGPEVSFSRHKSKIIQCCTFRRLTAQHWILGFVSGHDFSRAVKRQKGIGLQPLFLWLIRAARDLAGDSSPFRRVRPLGRTSLLCNEFGFSR
jgi:hypothetical protein